MKKTLLLLLSLAGLLLVLFVNSCKEEAYLVKDDDVETALKIWYENQMASLTKKEMFNALTPNWKDTQLYQTSDCFILEVTLSEPNQLIAKSNDENPKDEASKTYLKLLLFQKKSGERYGGYFMLNGTAPTALKMLRYNNLAGFSGMINYYGLDNTFTNGYQMANGQVVKTLMPNRYSIENQGRSGASQKNLNIAGNGKVMNAPPPGGCIVYTFDVYQEFCTTVEIGEVSAKRASGVAKLMNTTVTTCDWRWVGSFEASSCESGGNSGPVYIPHSGGGSAGGTSAPKEIKNNVKNPCLKQTIDEALSSNKDVKGFLSDLINKYAGKNNGIIINISDANISGAALTRPTFLSNGTFKADIEFKDGYYDDVSKEAVIAALLHEVVHAYLLQTNSDYRNKPRSEQHSFLFTNFVGDIGTYLINKYGMPKNDAYALAWSGMGDLYNSASTTDTFKTIKNPVTNEYETMTKDDIGMAVAPYKHTGTNSKGTPNCPKLIE